MPKEFDSKEGSQYPIRRRLTYTDFHDSFSDAMADESDVLLFDAGVRALAKLPHLDNLPEHEALTAVAQFRQTVTVFAKLGLQRQLEEKTGPAYVMADVVTAHRSIALALLTSGHDGLIPKDEGYDEAFAFADKIAEMNLEEYRQIALQMPPELRRNLNIELHEARGMIDQPVVKKLEALIGPGELEPEPEIDPNPKSAEVRGKRKGASMRDLFRRS